GRTVTSARRRRRKKGYSVEKNRRCPLFPTIWLTRPMPSPGGTIRVTSMEPSRRKSERGCWTQTTTFYNPGALTDPKGRRSGRPTTIQSEEPHLWHEN